MHFISPLKKSFRFVTSISGVSIPFSSSFVDYVVSNEVITGLLQSVNPAILVSNRLIMIKTIDHVTNTISLASAPSAAETVTTLHIFGTTSLSTFNDTLIKNELSSIVEMSRLAKYREIDFSFKINGSMDFNGEPTTDTEEIKIFDENGLVNYGTLTRNDRTFVFVPSTMFALMSELTVTSNILIPEEGYEHLYIKTTVVRDTNNKITSVTFYFIDLDDIALVRCRMNQKTLLSTDPEYVPPTPITVYWTWEATDPINGLLVNDTLTYLNTGTSSSNTNFSLDFHTMPAQQYAVIKVPASEPIKTLWNDTGSIFNNGSIPDSVFRASFVTGAFRYYVSRIPVDFDTNANSRLILS